MFFHVAKRMKGVSCDWVDWTIGLKEFLACLWRGVVMLTVSKGKHTATSRHCVHWMCSCEAFWNKNTISVLTVFKCWPRTGKINKRRTWIRWTQNVCIVSVCRGFSALLIWHETVERQSQRWKFSFILLVYCRSKRKPTKIRHQSLRSLSRDLFKIPAAMYSYSLKYKKSDIAVVQVYSLISVI